MHGRTSTNAYSKALPLFGLVLLVSLSACGSLSPDVRQETTATPSPVATLSPSRYQITERQNVAYGPLAAEKLDLCEPVGAPSPRPGVLLIHGGGWTEVDKTKDLPFFQTTCTWLASKGFVVANINYRLANTTATGNPDPKDMWPAQLVDVQLAVRWMRTQAQQIRLDPTRLCAEGFSSGAHLAVFLGSLAKNHAGDEASFLGNQSPKVSCVVDFYGPVDLTTIVYYDAYLALFGAAYTSAVLRDASPVFAVSAQSAATLIIQGTRDTLVPQNQAMELYQALQHKHVSVQYIGYDGDHALQRLSPSQAQHIEAQAAIYLAVHLHL